jgi:hypothetical protein
MKNQKFCTNEKLNSAQGFGAGVENGHRVPNAAIATRLIFKPLLMDGLRCGSDSSPTAIEMLLLFPLPFRKLLAYGRPLMV